MISFTILPKFVINLHIKFIFPKMDWTTCLLLGEPITYISSNLFGLTLNPLLDTMCTRRFPSINANKYFLGLKDKPYLWHLRKNLLKWVECPSSILDKVLMSSKLMMMKQYFSFMNAMSTALWNMPPTFISLNGFFHT